MKIFKVSQIVKSGQPNTTMKVNSNSRLAVTPLSGTIVEPSSTTPPKIREDQKRVQQRRNSCDLVLTPAQQKSSHDSSFLADQIEASSSDTVEVTHTEEEEKTLVQLIRGNSSQLMATISNKEDFKHFLEERDVEVEARLDLRLSDAASTSSFENDDDSVGQEFANQVSSKKRSLPNSAASETIKHVKDRNSIKLSLHQHQAQAPISVKRTKQREESGRKRQKAKVRGSVVRANFQQSLQAMNLPLRNQEKLETKPSGNPTQPEIRARPPLQPRPTSAYQRLDRREYQQSTRPLRNLIHEVSVRAHREASPIEHHARPLSASQSLNKRFSSSMHSKNAQLFVKVGPNERQNDSSSGAKAMGPKISAEKPISSSDFTFREKLSGFAQRYSEEEDIPFANKFEAEFNNKLTPQSKFPAEIDVLKINALRSNSEARSLRDSKPQVNGRPEQPLALDSLSSNYINSKEAESIGSAECLDRGLTYVNSASNLSSFAHIKTLSSQQHLMNGARFDARRTQESRQVIVASKSTDNFGTHLPTGQLYDEAKNGGRQRRKYAMQQNSQVRELKMARINLKFVSINLFSKSLVSIDLSENQIKSLPEEIATISTLVLLKIDQNLIERLPSELWKLKKLKQLIASHNAIKFLPDRFEQLFSLECLQINDNLLTILPAEFGQLSNLEKLHLHENRLASLPRELSKLVNLVDFSLEWFMYTKPANSRIQKNPDVIKSVRDFCHNFQFNPGQTRLGKLMGSAKHSRGNSLAQGDSKGATQRRGKYVTFSDFVVQYHKIPHADVGLVNKIDFTMKKRSLVHQLCFNIHSHLIGSLLDQDQGAATGEANPFEETKVGGGQSFKMEGIDKESRQTQAAIAQVINLSKKDTQGVVPLCLLVMNMSPLERKKEETQPDQTPSNKQAGKDLAMVKSAANFFSQDWNNARSLQLNKRRKDIMRLLLSARDANGLPLVDINGSVSRKKSSNKIETLTKAITQPEERGGVQTSHSQHPILYWAVFKYQFKLAIELIEQYGADATVLNTNNSNLLHILFANYRHDLKYADKLAELLIAKRVNLNLIDKDGKAPLHVAIKKSQLEAIQFAHQHNIRRKIELHSDPTFTEASQLIQKSLYRLELFDFHMGRRSQVSPLHYAIKKSNYEAFMYLVKYRLCELLQRDEDQLTPRLTSLINSAFYRILLKQERVQVRRQIAQIELAALFHASRLATENHFQHRTQPNPQQSLLGFHLTQAVVVSSQRSLQVGPPVRVFALNEQSRDDGLNLLKKSFSLDSAHLFESNLVESQNNLKSPADIRGPKPASAAHKGDHAHKPFSPMRQDLFALPMGTMKNRQMGHSGMHSVGSNSPKIITESPISRKINLPLSIAQKTNNLESRSLAGFGMPKKSRSFLGRGSNPALWPDFMACEQSDEQLQFEQINSVCQYVYSRRSIYSSPTVQVEITEDVIQQNVLRPPVQGEPEDFDVVRRPNRSSTLRLSDKDFFEFTLGAGSLKSFKMPKEVSKQGKDSLSVKQSFSESRDIIPSQVQKPDLAYDEPNPTQYAAVELNDEQSTARLMNLESVRARVPPNTRLNKHKQLLQAQGMFRSVKGQKDLSLLSPPDKKVGPAMQLYQKRAMEMKPLTLKRPAHESPVKDMKRVDSDVSIPPSFRINDEFQLISTSREERKKVPRKHLGELKRHLLQCTDLQIDTEGGQQEDQFDMRLDDEVLQETMPKRTVAQNVFVEPIQELGDFETIRVMEGPARPGSSVVQGENLLPEARSAIMSPHFRDASPARQFENEQAWAEGNHVFKLPQKAISPRNLHAQRAQESEQVTGASRGGIFISNMNININLNININVPSERDAMSSQASKRKETLPEAEKDGGSNSQALQQSINEPHLSTILDEEQLNELEHRPKPSIGAKYPNQSSLGGINTDSFAAENLKTTSWGSLIESHAKQITQQQILSHLNANDIAQAVNQQIQKQSQPLFSSCDLQGDTSDGRDFNPIQSKVIHQSRLSHTASQLDQERHKESGPLEEQKMFMSRTPSQKQPIERKRISPRKTQLSQSNNLRTQNSENIETSFIGMTPSKPQFEQSALKDKQQDRQAWDQNAIQSQAVVGAGLESSPLTRIIQQKNPGSPAFSRPENEEELFAGRRQPPNGFSSFDHFEQSLTNQLESTNRRNNGQLGGLLTQDQVHQEQAFVGGRQRMEGDNPLASVTMLSASGEGLMKICTSFPNANGTNTYTLGNQRHDEQQVTLPSMTQNSGQVMQTGVSDIASQSPVLINPTSSANAINKKVGKVTPSMSKLLNDACTMAFKSNDSQVKLNPATQSQRLIRYESQLVSNSFDKEFKVICDSATPDWLKYQALYRGLAPYIQPVGEPLSKENKKKRDDALQCLELLFEVLAQDQNSLLADLIHLVAKYQVLTPRNKTIETILASLDQQNESLSESREVLRTTDDHTKIFKRRTFTSQTTYLSSFCLAQSNLEASNARSVHETYKKIQLSKFPTVSKNLGLFLKNKKMSEKANVKIVSREEIRRTQNIPLSLQKRVKLSMNERPRVLMQPLNEIMLTPRDTVASSRLEQAAQPDPVQSVPESHSTKLASQMKLLNEVSNANKPGFHEKLHKRLNESMLQSNSSKQSSFVATTQKGSFMGTSIDMTGISASKDLPSTIQPIRHIVSPKGFFPGR